jgi:acylglycerol lipase
LKSFEDRWEDKAGTSFFIRGWEPETQEPKALVALVHGLGEHAGRYLHVGKVLTDAGYALVGFDLRGHGKSGGARGHASSLDAYMQDIRQFFGWMETKYPAGPHFLYGHSLGGLFVLAYAIQYGAKFRGVITTGPSLRSSLQEQRAKIAMVRLLGSLLPTMTVQSGLDASTISRDSAIVESYRNDPLVHNSASLGFGKAALSAIDLCFARAREVPAPLLIIHGKKDRIAFSSGSEDFAGRVSAAGQDVTVRLWEDLYHEVHNEPEKEEVLSFMVEWLEKHI